MLQLPSIVFVIHCWRWYEWFHRCLKGGRQSSFVHNVFFVCKWGIGRCVHSLFIVFHYCFGFKLNWICSCLKGSQVADIVIIRSLFFFFFLCKRGIGWCVHSLFTMFVLHCWGLKRSWFRSCLKGSQVTDIVISTFLHTCVQGVQHFEAKLKKKKSYKSCCVRYLR